MAGKFFKCECKKTELTEKGQMILGFFPEEGETYFKGNCWLWHKGHWTGGDEVMLTKEDFKNAVIKFYEI